MFCKVGIVNVPQITDHGQLFKSNLTFRLFVLFVFLLCSGALTVHSSTPMLRINLNEHPILVFIIRIKKVDVANMIIFRK
jgi:hypothetical protein